MSDFPNDEQRQVIEYLHGPLLVLAPAGTGKTRVMAARLARALQKGIVPERTLCVTFTNRAANEMRRQIKATLGDRARAANLFTFHGLCAWILRQEAGDLGLSPDFVIYDDADSRELLDEIIRDLELQELLKCSSSDLLWELSEAKSSAVGEDLRVSGPPPLFKHSDAVRRCIADQYHQILSRREAVDFADLVHRVRAMLQDLPEKRNRWHERLDWIQVDEVQDTHSSEYDIVSQLGRRTGNLAFFGDVDQTIYEWRGSAPDEVLNKFRSDFGAPTEFNLSRTYRATRALLKAADCFAGSFGNRRTHLRPDDAVTAGDPVVAHGASTYLDEARWVAQAAKEITNKNPLAKSIAILVRKHERARVISRALTEAGVKHVTVEEFEFFRRQEIKDACARLRLILNPSDSGALHRITLRPAVGIGEKTVRRIADEGGPVALWLTDLVLPQTHRMGDPFLPLLDAWDRGTTLIVDVETTGLTPGQDEVVELAAVRMRAGEPASEFHRFLRPTVPVGESENVHGLSDDFLRENGDDPRAVFAEFLAFAQNAHVVGHNIRFDLAMLRSHARRLGLDARFDRWDDTLVVARRLVRAERYDLATLAHQFCLAAQPNHHALDDTRCTAELLTCLLPQLAQGSLARMAIVAREGRHFAALAEKMASWRSMAEVKRPPDLLASVLDDSGLAEYYRGDPRRSEHLRTLLDYFRSNDQPQLDPLSSLQDLAGKMALAKNIDHLDPGDSRIPVVTIHQAKGLEFDTVFVAGLTENEFPSFYALKKDSIEEERRLFYVAITRPKRRLFLSWHEVNENGFRNPRSRFVDDLGSG
jgi:DNA helicase-2/ATP-dependent DNA helicase PcrA